MAVTAAELQILITAKNQADATLKSIAVSITSLDKAAKAPASSLKDLGDHLSNLAGAPFKAVGGLVDGLGKLGLAAAGITSLASAAQGAGKALGVDFNSQMEQATIGFTTMLGSTDAAKKHLADLMNFAKTTPFEQGPLIEASQRLQAMGISADKVIPTLTAVGDAVSALGGGSALIDRVTLALGQMNAKGKVQADEMLQLTEAGIPAWDILAKKIGVSVPEAMDMVTRGLVSSRQAIDALTAGMEERFGGLMTQQSHTFQGAMSTISDSVQILMGQTMQPFFALISRGADQLATFLSSPQVGEWQQMMQGAMQGAADALSNFLGNVQQFGATFLTMLRNISRDNGLDTFQAAIVTTELTIRNYLGDQAATIFHDFVDAIQTVGRVAQEVFEGGIPGMVERLQGAFSDFAPTGERLGDLFSFLRDRVQDLLPYVRDAGERLDDVGQSAGGAEGLLRRLADVVNTVSGAIAGATKIVRDHQGVQEALVVVLTAAATAWGLSTAAAAAQAIALGVVRVATIAYAAAQAALNVLLTANPIGIVIVALAALAAGLIYTYKTNEQFREAVDKAWAAIKTGVAAAIAFVTSTIDAFIAWFQAQGGTVQGAAMAIGEAISNGIKAGVQNTWQALVNKLAGLVDMLPAAVKELLGIKSPSAVFADIGEDVVAGFAEGIDASDPAIQAATDLGDGVTEAVTDAVSGAADSVPDIMDQLAAALGTAVPRALTPVEKEVADFNDRVASETTKFNRKMADLQDQLAETSKNTNQKIEDENLRHTRKLADIAADRASNQTPAAVRAANAAVQDENTRHQRALADIDRKGGEDQEKARQSVLDKIAQLEEDHNRRVEDLQSEHSDNMVDAEQEMGRRRGQAIADFVSGFDDLNTQVTQRSSQIAADAARDTQNAINDARDGIAQAVQNAKDAINDLENNQLLNRAIRARRASFSGTQDAASQTRQRAQEDLDLQKKQADDVQKFQDDAAKQASDLAAQRAREDADAQYQLQRDLSRAKTADDAAQIQQRFDDQKADRDRSRRLDDAERANRLQDNKTELNKRQAQERQALADRRAQQDADRQFQQQQAQALQQFNDTLDDEALRRQIGRIIDERDQRIQSINDALEKKEQAIRDNEARERDILNQSYEAKLKDLKANFFDKLGPLTDAQMLIVTAFLDGVAGKASDVQALISKVTTPGPAAQPAPAKGSGAPAGGGSSGAAGPAKPGDVNVVNPSTPSSIVIQSPGGSVANVDVDAINSGKIRLFAEGGVVPGPKGAKQLAWVHGGEAVFNPDQLAALGAGLQGGASSGGTVIVLDGVAVGRMLTPYNTTSQARYARIAVP